LYMCFPVSEIKSEIGN